MKKVLLGIGVSAALIIGLVAIQHGSNDVTAAEASPADTQTVVEASQVSSEQSKLSTAESDLAAVLAVGSTPASKKCSFSSDCKYGKCKSGKCGGCSFTSDCKGWGKCGKGWCGKCSFSSECKGFGKCSSGKCTKSPY